MPDGTLKMLNNMKDKTKVLFGGLGMGLFGFLMFLFI